MAKTKGTAAVPKRSPAGKVIILSRKGKLKAAAVAAPPMPPSPRPGDIYHGPLGGGASEPFLLVDNYYFWNGNAWENSSTIVQLSPKEIQNLAKTRRAYLKQFGYL